MSFLNPVNEPVLRFSSTDASAPQINYNSRVAGDVKTVLKACLVTGYGDKASAGWSVVNEAGDVAEFISPSAAMSDYRLGIDDTSTSSATWYYQYQDVRTDALKNPQKKSLTNAFDKSHISNGWQLLITTRGLVFVEIIYNVLINNNIGRITHLGLTKAAVQTTGVNIATWDVGPNATSRDPTYFFSEAGSHSNIHVSDYVFDAYSSANIENLKKQQFISTPLVELISPLYMYAGGVLLAQQPGVLIKSTHDEQQLYGVYDDTVDSRPVLNICASYDFTSASAMPVTARNFLIYLDYWEY